MDSVTLALTGQMPFILITSVILSVPVSFILLWLYRRAVLISMNRQTDADLEQSHAATINNQATILKIKIVEANQSASCDQSCTQFVTRLKRSPWKNALIYAKGGAAFTLIMTAAVLLSGTSDFFIIRALLVFCVYAWPIVLTLNLVAASSRKDILITVGAYFSILIVLTILALIKSNELTLGQVFMLWGITNLPPTVLILAFLVRPIRAVGPMVLAFMILALTGSVIALALIGSSDEALRSVAEAGYDVGMGASGAFISVLIIGFILFALIGWLVVNLIRKGYQERILNDQSMTLDSLWLLFAIVQSIGLVFENAAWIFAGVIAFVAYKLVVKHGFARLQKETRIQNIRLLLLRVFSLGKRSEQLFNRVTKHWRYVGSVQLISGPDLATTTVEPHEFIGFLSGKISRHFIGTQQQLDQRLIDLDMPMDFDGRYRINDFFCFGNTWEAVLSQLVKSTNAVIMDLRGFTPRKTGCVRELNELINVTLLGRVVLVIDATTDVPFLEQTIQQSWQNILEDSPNLQTDNPEIVLFKLSDLSADTISNLLSWLSMAATRK